MTVPEIFRLSHREFTAYRTRSISTIITVGILFGFLLGVLFFAQGAENVTLKYARVATNGEIYLATDYKNAEIVVKRIYQYGGEIIELTDDQENELGDTLQRSTIIAKWNNLQKAYEYYSKDDASTLHYNPNDYRIIELFGNQIRAYEYFRIKDHDIIRPVSIILVITSAFILAFTMAHLISNNTKSFMLYRSIGASRTQILLIYFAYLLELCFWATLFAIIFALLIAGGMTAFCWEYLTEQLTLVYPYAPKFAPVLIGINPRVFAVIASIFLTAPLSFLLCIDQFSNKKIAQKLKGD